MPLLAGTSGWQYRDWRGQFYPAGLAQASWLSHYAQTFPAVENNGTFYRLAAPKTFDGWRESTPDGFVMAVKASRYLTHIRRLRDPAEPVERLLAGASRLGGRLGPVLLQLPPTMPADHGLLDACLAEFGRQAADVRVAVEFRHQSWWSEQARTVLSRHNAALCWADRRGRPISPLWRTADWGYLRLHEGAATPWPRYGRQALRSWLARLSAAWPATCDVFAFFNNDQNAAAPTDAAAMLALAARAAPARR
jgi:uncharacterized protein YecE (DUF72 family)